MTIEKAYAFFNEIHADTKSERRIYSCFRNVIASLSEKDLTAAQSRAIQEKLTSLHLTEAKENPKKFYKKQLQEFLAFLKKEYDFTTERHYTELYMVYGMSLGSAIGLAIGSAIDIIIGTSVGMSMGIGVGICFGLLWGAKKDNEAKSLGKVV